jgi:ADP-heptose:LPS heptosyltransferase
LLRCGRFEEGWPLSTFRGNLVSQSSALPPWQADVPCHRLLILPPKDLGDQIMLASLLSEASALAPEPALLADPRLHSLLARSFPRLRVLAPGQPFHTAQFQAQIRMGSLAAHLRPSKEHFLSHRQAYLVADPAKTQAFRQRHLPGQAVGQAGNGELLVGICWCSTSPANGVMKSLSLETLAGALAAPGVRLLSLQYGDTRSERDQLRRATGLDVLADPEVDTFTDIDNLASLIAACDVVVSVSNTTAHLAGALGQRTWLLIDSRLDWRWGLNDPDSLWTPATRLFRQPTAGDWATPLAAVQAELQALRRQGSIPAPTTPAPRRERWVF